jgi:hypothetical protein
VLHPPADQVGPPQTLGDVLLRPPLVRQWFDNVSKRHYGAGVGCRGCGGLSMEHDV